MTKLSIIDFIAINKTTRVTTFIPLTSETSQILSKILAVWALKT